MRQISAAERAAVWIAALLIVAAIAALTAAHGALGIPRNDDWSYLRVALDLAETGQVQLTGWVQMFFIGQAVLAQPVITLTAGSTAALQIFVGALAVASLVLAYDLARRILPPALAALAVLPLALGPMFGSLALSFMTDIPALFLTLITLSFGAATLNANGRRRSILLACAAASGVFAFTIREYGLLAWIAVALTVLWQIFTERTTPRTSRNVLPVILLFGSSLVAAALLWAWRSQLPGTLATGIAIPRTIDDVTQSLATLSAALITLGIGIAPAICAISPTRLLRRWSPQRVIATGAIVTAALLIAFAARGPFPLGNLLTEAGNYPDTIIGTREIPLLPAWAMAALAVIGLLSLIAVGLVFSCAAQGVQTAQPEPDRSTERLFAVYVALTWLLLVGFALLLNQLWDRYLLAIIPITAALVLTAARRRGLIITPRWAAIPALAMAVFALLGLAFTDRAATVDGAAWAVAEVAVAEGQVPELIDGGFAWNGTWQPGQATWPAPLIPGQPWWRALYPGIGYCTQVEVTQAPLSTQRPQTQVLQTQTLFGTHLWFAVVPNPAAADYSDTLPQC